MCVIKKCYEKFHRNRGAKSQGDTQSKYWEEMKLMNRSPWRRYFCVKHWLKKTNLDL